MKAFERAGELSPGERSASESDAKKDRESVGRMPAHAGHRPFLASGEDAQSGHWGPIGVLREFNPVSWFHPRGIYRVLARLKPRLPDVAGKLFLTFTVNPLLFADPLAAFEHARDRLRRIFFKLRQGVTWEGKRYVVNAPYAVKVEFHKSGWAHFHVVFLTRSYVPGGLLNELWALGRTNVRRISNQEFRYLLKYVSKGGGLPEWVLGHACACFSRHEDSLLGFQSRRAGECRRARERGSIALQPGVAMWVRYFEPKTDNSVRLEGEIVVEFPKLKEFQQVTIHATRIKSDEHTGQLVIRSGELVA